MRLFSGSVAALALTTAVGLVSGTTTPSASAAAERRADPVTLVGSGWGHAHGMSQHGAQGAAKQGLSAGRILDFYYPGTASGRAGGSIKVLVTADSTSNLIVQHKSGLSVRSVATGKTWKLDKRGAKRWKLTPAGSKTRLWVKTKAWHAVRDIPGAAEFKGGVLRLYVPGGSALYRGKLRAVSGDTVNVVSVETYLRGVVPAEMPAGWLPAAVQAQAVAARSYAIFERDNARHGYFDVWDTTQSQVYRGVGAEAAGSDAAIRATAGVVRTYQGKPAFTQFGSSNGGWMAAGSQPYLVTKQDPYDPATPWSVTLTPAQIEQQFPGIGPFTKLVITADASAGGRVTKVKIVGTGGKSTTLTGDQFRVRFGLRSTLFHAQ
jgi:SpoIID/LytB domain protein